MTKRIVISTVYSWSKYPYKGSFFIRESRLEQSAASVIRGHARHVRYSKASLSAMKFGHRFQQVIEQTHPSVSDQVCTPNGPRHTVVIYPELASVIPSPRCMSRRPQPEALHQIRRDHETHATRTSSNTHVLTVVHPPSFIGIVERHARHLPKNSFCATKH